MRAERTLIFAGVRVDLTCLNMSFFTINGFVDPPNFRDPPNFHSPAGF